MNNKQAHVSLLCIETTELRENPPVRLGEHQPSQVWDQIPGCIGEK